MSPDWLPPLMLLNDYGGDWGDYVEAVYRCFVTDFKVTRAEYDGQPVHLWQGLSDGKEDSFWHVTSGGDVEEEREPELRRCERVGWVRPMIENASDPELKCWENQRRGSTRIIIALSDFSYVVVLDKRRGRVVLWTAYCVDRSHTRNRLEKEYADYMRLNALMPP